MNVAELIELLGKYPSELTVTVDGSDGGVTETVVVQAFLVDPDQNEGYGYMGEHAPLVLAPDEDEEDYPDRRPVLNLSRRREDHYVHVEPVHAEGVDAPRRRFTFIVAGHAHTIDDLADQLRDALDGIERERVIARTSSQGYSLRITDHGGPTEAEYEDQLEAWFASRDKVAQP